MSPLKLATLLACCGVLLIGCRRPPDIFSFQLALSNGSRLNFETLEHNKATVFVFLAPDCPQSQSYTLTLNNLEEAFRDSRVEFYGVVTGAQYDRKEIDAFISKYQVRLPMLLDPETKLAKFLDATVTPEAFVVSPDAIPIYGGAIDNWVPELGEHRTVITEHYLLDALNSFLRIGDVPVHRTEAVGCFIERKS